MATYSKYELYIITRRLYRLFKKHPEMFELKKLRNNSGYYNFPTKISKPKIEIDYREDIISTIVHEACHHWYPDWTETEIREAERNIINQLSIKQIKNVIKKFGDIL